MAGLRTEPARSARNLPRLRGRAGACEPEPGPYWTVASTSPQDGEEGVRINAGIVVDATPWGKEGDSFWIDPFVVEELGAASTDAGAARTVSGDFISWQRDDGARVWVPDEPFRPFTRYRVEATIPNSPWPMAPDGVEGPTSVSTTFTTGDASYGPLAFAGKLEVELEAFKRRRRAARLPRWLLITEGEPAPIDGPESLGAETGDVWISQLSSTPAESRLSLREEVPEIERAYVPCVAVAVWDTGGRWISDSLCLDELSPRDWLVANDGPGPASTDGGTVSGVDVPNANDTGADAGSETPSHGSSAGCALRQSTRNGSGWLLGLAVMLFGLRRASLTRTATSALRARPTPLGRSRD